MSNCMNHNGVLVPAPVHPARAPWRESLVLAVGFYLLLYASFSPGLPNTWINKIHALQAATFLSAAFLIGALARFWPDSFEPLKPYRRPLGVLGAFSAAAHVFMVYVPLRWSPSGWTFAFGALALLMFLAMALTSNRRSLERLGYPLWKRFHALGYVALLLVAVHFVLATTKNGVLSLNPLEISVLVLVVVTLIARAAAFMAGSPMRHSYEEHFEPQTRSVPSASFVRGRTGGRPGHGGRKAA